MRALGGRQAVVAQLDRDSIEMLSTCLAAMGVRGQIAAAGATPEQCDCDLAFLDVGLAAQAGRWLERGVAVVLVGEPDDDASVDDAVVHWLERPLRPRQVRRVVANALERLRLRRALSTATRQLAADLPSTRVVARSAAMRRTLEQLGGMRVDEQPLVLCGEPGSGRRLLARLVASAGGRGVFEVGPAELAEDTAREQLYEWLAGRSGEQLLVRQVERCPRETREALLVALERAQPRLIVTASVEASRAFPQSVRAVPVPSLRERSADLLPLARLFLDHYDPGARFGRDAEAALAGYGWPGNVVELRNTVERLALRPAVEVTAADLPAPVVIPARGAPQVGGDFTLAELEEAHLRRVLGREQRMAVAAQTLGINDSTLWRMRRRYHLP